jgi:hypothetical protein
MAWDVSHLEYVLCVLKCSHHSQCNSFRILVEERAPQDGKNSEEEKGLDGQRLVRISIDELQTAPT